MGGFSSGTPTYARACARTPTHTYMRACACTEFGEFDDGNGAGAFEMDGGAFEMDDFLSLGGSVFGMCVGVGAWVDW